MSLGSSMVATRKIKPKLGLPDVYPQNPDQKEDDLSAVHVKQGFTTSYINLTSSDEYGSAISKAAQLQPSKIWNSLKDILVKKEDLNTLQESKDKNKKQPINIRDDFWLVTGKNKNLCDKYFRDLAGDKDYKYLAKKVPIFNRNEEIIIKLVEFDVPSSRGVWLIKMTAAYKGAMNEANKSKKRATSDPCSEWTNTLTGFIREQRAELVQIVNTNNTSTGLASLAEEVSPEKSLAFKHLNYTWDLCGNMYSQGLLDRQEFLQFIVDCVEKTRDPEEPLFRLLMPQLMRYCGEFPHNELLARKLSYHCARKITTLVLETEAYAANSDPNNPDNKDKVVMLPGTSEPLPPTFAGLMELQRDRDYCRMIIMTLSAVIMQVTQDCPTAMVWHYWSDNKTPSSLLGSPMDVLPDVRPYALCTPTRDDTTEVRQRIKAMVMHADERSRAVYEHWANIGADSSTHTKYATVGKILTVLEELDRFSFDSSTKDSCMDVLHKKVWGDLSSHVTGSVSAEDEAVVMILCQWAVTNKRSGDHRGFIAAKLLEQRQADILSHDNSENGDKDEEDNFYTGPPIFQHLLFKFLDTEAPYFTTPPQMTSKKIKNEVANLVLLFHELMTHEVFSHDAYLCALISRGDLNTPLQRTTSSASEFEGTEAGGQADGPGGHSGFPQGPGEVWRYSRHWQYTYHFPIPCNSEDNNNHDVNQRHVILYGIGRGKDETTKQVKKLSKEILKLFSKRFSVDVAEGGKIKKHNKSEFIFSDVVTKFQELSYFDQHSVTSQCGHAVTEMVSSFHTSSSAIHLPVIDHVSFLFDLAGQALNIQNLLDWCIALLKELPMVETQLLERSSVLTRVYTTNLTLYIVGVLKRYHAVLILSDTDVRVVWDSLVRISYRVPVPQESPRHESSGSRRPLPNLDCNSAEWNIMGYLFDLVTSCPMLRSVNETAKEKYQGLKRLFAYSYSPELPSSLSSNCINEQFVDMFKVYIRDPKNRKVDPLVVRYLHERQENQYSLVVSVLISVINDQLDTETLNNLAILCCELTSQCSSLAQEWLGALSSLCCPSPDPRNDPAFDNLLSRVNIMEPIHDRLGVFVSILIARQCFSLQAFVVKVVARSLLQAWNENRGSPGPEAEAGARLSIHLLRRLFGTVESFQPCFYTIASPRAYPSNPLGLKLSCDRHLLASTHANVSSGIILGAIVAVLKALLVLGHSAPKSSVDVSSMTYLSEDDLAKLPLGDLALWSLQQICSQEWVRDRCLQVPDDLFSKHILLDPELKPHQAQSLLRMICHMQLPASMKKVRDTSLTIGHVLEELDEWSLRAFMVDIKLMYYRLEERKSEWVEEVSRCIVDSFQLGENSEDEAEDEPRAKRIKLDKERKMKKKYGPIWMVPHLVKHLKFLQPKILKVAAYELERHNWSRNSKVRISAGHQPFLQLILMCLKEGEYSDKDKSVSREEREQEKEHLLQSLYNQVSMFLCFTSEEKSYNYEDPTARKTMLDALKLRFSLIGGLFESIIHTQNSIGDWSTLMVQLIVRGVVDLTNNTDLFTMVLDMLSLLIHSTLIREKESGSSDRDEDNKRMYQQLVKKLKKEIGDKQNESIRYLRQLLPLPKCAEEVIVTEQYGLIPDAKGNKVKGFNCDKKQGLQVAEKQKVSPWDILEGHKNPAPLSWNWFQAIKTERKPLKYEEAFQNMRYMKNTLLKPASYYLEDPPLPQEDLEPTKDSKEDEKNNKNKEEMEMKMNGNRGLKRGQSRAMSPGPMATGGPNTMYRGQMGGPGPGGGFGGQQPPNMAYMGGNKQQGMGGPGGPAMGQQMGYNQSNMGYMPGPGGQGPGQGNYGPNMGNMGPGNIQGQPGYSGGPGMMGGPGSSNTKMAIHQMISNRRMPGPSGPGMGQQMGGGMGGPGGMMRPSGQYGGNMMPAGGNMGPMNRPMYGGPGGQGMANMNSNYGMQGGQGYGGFAGNNPAMRMNTPNQPMGGPMRTGPGQYGMGGMNQGMGGMSNMPMSRGNMMNSAAPGYGMAAGQGRQSGYGMQGGMGPGAMGGPSNMGGPGPNMMGGMRQMAPGMMSGGGMQPGMQGQNMGGMGMQNNMGPGMMSGMQGGMQQGPGGSQLMAHLQRGNTIGPGSGGQGMGYQQNRF